ncbi:MAG: hypothetical protein ACSLE0_11080 [Chitinophagaceae bacterium]
MDNRATILQELEELKSHLGKEGFETPYRTPVGYFDGLSDIILKRVKAIEYGDAKEELAGLSPLLGSMSKKTPYSIPASYFDLLQKEIRNITGEDKIQSAKEEIEDLSPLLSTLKIKKPFTVPEGYFEKLQPVQSASHESKTKIVSITHRKWFRYAAAALVIGFISTIGFLNLNKKEIDPAEKSYAWVKKNLKKVSTDDIDQFVKSTNTESTDVVKLEAKDEIINLLKDVSDKEIQDFLNETGSGESNSNDDSILN